MVNISPNDCFTNDCKSSPFLIIEAKSGNNITENKYEMLFPASKSRYALAYMPAWIADMSLGKIRSINTGSKRL